MRRTRSAAVSLGKRNPGRKSTWNSPTIDDPFSSWNLEGEGKPPFWGCPYFDTWKMPRQDKESKTGVVPPVLW